MAFSVDRCSDAARRTLFSARLAASEYGGTELQTEHLVYGLVQELGSTIQKLLSPGWSFERLQKQVVTSLPRGPQQPKSIEMPFSPGMGAVLENAATEAEHANQQIRPDHLLLAVFGESDTSMGQLFREAGLSREAIRALFNQ